MFRRTNKKLSYLATDVGIISFCLTRSSRRRSIMIRIEETAQISVVVPFYAKLEEIHQFIREKACWIQQKVEQTKVKQAFLKNKHFSTGQEFLFFGKRCKLEVIEKNINRSQIIFSKDRWSVSIPSQLSLSQRQEEVKGKIIQWYRTQAKEILGSRVFYYSRIIGIEPKEIVIRTQKRLWGCCHYYQKTISLNWQIVMTPIKVIDYVIIHELCHLTYPNHSSRFWKRVEKFMPDYREQKRWLKLNQLQLKLPE